MIVVDSSVWIDHFNGVGTREADLLNALLGVSPIMTGDLIIAEVLQGFRRTSDMHQAREALESLVYQPMVGRKIALASAYNYRALRAQGITIRKTVDMLVATFCMENGHQLLHSDRDFDSISQHLALEVL